MAHSAWKRSCGQIRLRDDALGGEAALIPSPGAALHVPGPASGTQRVWRDRAGAEGRTPLTQEACETRPAGAPCSAGPAPAPVPNLRRGFAAAFGLLPAPASRPRVPGQLLVAKGSRRCSEAPWPGPATWELPGHLNDTPEKQQKHARSGARLSRGLRACTFTRQQNRGDAVEVTIYLRKRKGEGKRERKTSTGLLRAPGAGVPDDAPN